MDDVHADSELFADEDTGQVGIEKTWNSKTGGGGDRVSGIRRRRLYYRSGIAGRWRHADVAKKAEANLAQDSFEIAAQGIFRT